MTRGMPILRLSNKDKPSKRQKEQPDQQLSMEDIVSSCKDVDVIRSHADTTQGEDLCLFHRDEIKIGNLVGSGSFSEVYEISSFAYDNSNISKKLNINRKHSKSLDPSRRRKRNQLVVEQEENHREQCSGKALQSRFVIKQLHAKLLGDPKLFRRAVKDMACEATIMSQLTNHPHIAQLRATAIGGTGAFANGKHDSFFLVLDRLVETLEDRINQWQQEKIAIGPSYYLDNVGCDAKIELKAAYSWQVASALQFLHERNIVFRDLKPQNIGFKEVHPDHPEKDVLALFDFGLSRTLPPADQANEQGLFRMSMVGTRRYMAPEIVVDRTYNSKVDTYSWALVFFELISQMRPFDGMQRGEHKEFVCVQGKRPKVYSYYGLPAELERLVRLAWAQDVSQRITMGEVCQTLQSYLAGTIHENAVKSVDSASSESSPHGGMPQDDSASSILSGNTATSTAFSFSSDEEKENEKDDDGSSNSDPSGNIHAARTFDAATDVIRMNGTVPQAIAVSTTTFANENTTLRMKHDDDDKGSYQRYPARHVSMCEKVTDMFRSSLAHCFRMFCGYDS